MFMVNVQQQTNDRENETRPYNGTTNDEIRSQNIQRVLDADAVQQARRDAGIQSFDYSDPDGIPF